MHAGFPTAQTAGGGPITALGEADLEGALALVAESGWNQVRADWQLFTDLGAAFKLSTPGGAVTATAATLPFARFGWISMVLVAKTHRRQGIATMLLQHCVARLRAQDLVPVLDATPAGREVYRTMGFRDGWPITRWRRGEAGAAVPHSTASGDTAVRPLREHDWPAIAELDARSFGADRTALLRRLAARSRGFACVCEQQGRTAGFLLGRDGRQATQIGPVVGRNHEIAIAMLWHALPRIGGPVLLDVLDRHAELPTQLKAAGFAVERGYTRMALAADPDFGDAALTVAIAGPELG